MEAPYFIIHFSCNELMVRKIFWNVRSFFKGKADLLEEVFNKHEHLREQIEQKNIAYQELLRHKHHLEEMVAERTAQYKEQRDLAEDKTRELRETQTKLFETEKRVLEHRITGGFAHEMRNALTGAQLEMKAVLDYREQGKAGTEVIKEAATNLLKQIKDLQAEYQIPKDQIAQTLIPPLKEIAQVIEFLSETHQDVYHDLERGLSITSQIRDYAKMAELRPGNDPVDLVALLKRYETRYAKDCGDQKIRYSVSGPDTLILLGDEIHFNSIFSNLILNARDALMETEKADKQIRITIESIEKDGKPQVQIQVRDNGPGIPEKHLPEIFEPFFSTKPSSGTGLGLGIVRRLVQLYEGQIEVESEASQGTCFIVILPDRINR
jgi:histidine kinase